MLGVHVSSFFFFDGPRFLFSFLLSFSVAVSTVLSPEPALPAWLLLGMSVSRWCFTPSSIGVAACLSVISSACTMHPCMSELLDYSLTSKLLDQNLFLLCHPGLLFLNLKTQLLKQRHAVHQFLTKDSNCCLSVSRNPINLEVKKKSPQKELESSRLECVRSVTRLSLVSPGDGPPHPSLPAS